MTQNQNSYPTVEIPEQRVDREQLTAQLKKEILEGNRLAAAKTQGQLLELKPVTFPEGTNPKVWKSGDVRQIDNPLQQLDGKNGNFMKDRLKALAEQPGNPRTRNITEHFLSLAGVQGENGRPVELPNRPRQTPAETALESLAARTLADEVGTFTEASGGISYRSPDGQLNSFRLPTDEARAGAVMTSLEEAGYRQTAGEGLPVIITNNPAQNVAAFAAVGK